MSSASLATPEGLEREWVAAHAGIVTSARRYLPNTGSQPPEGDHG